MIPLDDEMTNEKFLPGSILGQFSEDMERWNIYIKVDEYWALVMERRPVPTKIRYSDIITGSMYPINHNQIWILRQVTEDTKEKYAQLLQEMKEGTALPGVAR